MTQDQPIRTALITGIHTYEVPPLHDTFRSIPEIAFYPMHMEDFVGDRGGFRESYDVLVFYNHHKLDPYTVTYGGKNMGEALESLGESGQGMLFLHHALVALGDWPQWQAMTGIVNKLNGYKHDEELAIHIENPDHPITQGLIDWTMLDEAYDMGDCFDDNDILLTTEHPNCMRTLAWTRQYKKSRVLSWAAGHDPKTWENPGFQAFLRRGLLWLAGRI